MFNNPVQFAVVREDPEVETQLIRLMGKVNRVLLVGSGGCTALTLRARFPDMEFTLVEPNQSQIDLIRRKTEALSEKNLQLRYKTFGISEENVLSLNSCGNFEALFRCLRKFLYEFVLDYPGWKAVFEGKDCQIEAVFKSKYWPVAFDLFFSDSILRAMFGQDAVQHAPPGSYPTYFRNVLERGLRSEKMAKNYFLHHIFLGHYLDDLECLPPYLSETTSPHSRDFKFLQCFAQDVSDFSQFDLVSLSNIFDWMGEDQIERIAKRLAKELKPGSYVLFRQLNHLKDFRSLFGTTVCFDNELSSNLHSKDRSLFYSDLGIGRKVAIV